MNNYYCDKTGFIKLSFQQDFPLDGPSTGSKNPHSQSISLDSGLKTLKNKVEIIKHFKLHHSL